MGYKVVPLEPWGSGNAVEAIGIAPQDVDAAKALGFPRPGHVFMAPATRARPPARRPRPKRFAHSSPHEVIP